MDEKITELKALALENYEAGGHWIVECWDDSDYLEHIERCNISGKDPAVELEKDWKIQESYANDIRNA